MFEKLNYIELSGKRYPFKCDMLVLEKIQDKYEKLNEFENKLSGFVPSEDEDGEYIKNDEGNIIGTFGIPDIRVLNDALFWMIEEGIDIQRESGEEVKNVTREELLRKVDMPPKQLGKLLHTEFFQCFERKNQVTTQGETMESPEK